MKVTIKGSYTILGKIYSDQEEYPVIIKCPPETKPEIILEINPKEQSVEAFGDFDITDEFWNILGSKEPVQKIPDSIEKEASAIRTHLTTSTKHVLNDWEKGTDLFMNRVAVDFPISKNKLW